MGIRKKPHRERRGFKEVRKSSIQRVKLVLFCFCRPTKLPIRGERARFPTVVGTSVVGVYVRCNDSLSVSCDFATNRDRALPLLIILPRGEGSEADSD